LSTLFQQHPTVILTGGSMMYIDAVCYGIDEIPTVTAEIRKTVREQYEQSGLPPLLSELKTTDPVHFEEVDRSNHKRVIHAIEICRMTGRPYSSFRTRQIKERPFRMIKIGLTLPREELYERINERVDRMMQNGLLEEARRCYPFRHCNALNTVGYKELFSYFDGIWTLETAVEKIKRNTRIYARKQMTWFKRASDIHWFHPNDMQGITSLINTNLR